MIHRFVATVGEQAHEVSVEVLADATDGNYRVTVDGRTRTVDARRVEPGTWSLLTPGGGPARLVDVDTKGPDFMVGVGGHNVSLKLVEGRRAAVAGVAMRARPSGPQPVRAPMPGKVVKVLVKAGEAVKAGQGVVVMEAMKMENELKAPRDAAVGEVLCGEGQAVESGQVLLTLV